MSNYEINWRYSRYVPNKRGGGTIETHLEPMPEDEAARHVGNHEQLLEGFRANVANVCRRLEGYAWTDADDATIGGYREATQRNGAIRNALPSIAERRWLLNGDAPAVCDEMADERKAAYIEAAQAIRKAGANIGGTLSDEVERMAADYERMAERVKARTMEGGTARPKHHGGQII